MSGGTDAFGATKGRTGFIPIYNAQAWEQAVTWATEGRFGERLSIANDKGGNLIVCFYTRGLLPKVGPSGIRLYTIPFSFKNSATLLDFLKSVFGELLAYQEFFAYFWWSVHSIT